MPYSPFDEFFLETAKRETRNITFLGSMTDVPDKTYILRELYCNEPDCDCRRVMLNVTSVENGEIEAVIAFGWEGRNFYRSWFGRDDPEIVSAMKGPVLNRDSAQSEHAEALLMEIADKVLSQPSYVERLKRHYQMFRRKIDGQVEPVRNTERKVGRNEPCPCNSGRKWKQCCGSSTRRN